jgi:hypothetical protein
MFLNVGRLDILRGSIILNQPDIAITDLIHRITVRRRKVDSDGIRPRGDHEDRRDNHGEARAVVHVGHMAQEGRHDGAAADAAHDEARAALVVPAQAADAECDDGGEADGFEEHGDEEHGCQSVSTCLREKITKEREHTDATFIPLRNGRSEEGHHPGEIYQKDPARTHVFHEQGAGEAADGEGALGAGEVLGARGARGAGPGFDGVVDEVACDADCCVC